MSQHTHQEPTPTNKLVWFEIPATNMDRAIAFYQKMLNVTLQDGMVGPVRMAVFPYIRPAISGCIMEGPRPSDGGVQVYLNAEPSLDAALARVESAGGEIVHPRTELTAETGGGAFAKVRDTEGNVVGLHSPA